MAKTIAIISSTAAFSLIGLLAGFVGASNLLPSSSRSHKDLVLLLAMVPPFVGAIGGLVVGCFAVFLGSKLQGKQS